MITFSSAQNSSDIKQLPQFANAEQFAEELLAGKQKRLEKEQQAQMDEFKATQQAKSDEYKAFYEQLSAEFDENKDYGEGVTTQTILKVLAYVKATKKPSFWSQLPLIGNSDALPTINVEKDIMTFFTESQSSSVYRALHKLSSWKMDSPGLIVLEQKINNKWEISSYNLFFIGRKSEYDYDYEKIPFNPIFGDALEELLTEKGALSPSEQTLGFSEEY